MNELVVMRMKSSPRRLKMEMMPPPMAATVSDSSTRFAWGTLPNRISGTDCEPTVTSSPREAVPMRRASDCSTRMLPSTREETRSWVRVRVSSMFFSAVSASR